MMPTPKPRWGFRTRLTALIAAVFVTGGIALLGVQYLLVQQLFGSAIDSITHCVDEDGITVVTGSEIEQVECLAVAQVSGHIGGVAVSTDSDGYSFLIQQSTVLSQEVLSGLLLWSLVTLLAFTAVAILAAFWLSRRSFTRIAQITETTRRINRDDLHQRLELPGPADEIKELGDTIDTMLDRLEAAFTQQERFVTNASHELRTPLTTTRAALEIPLEQGRVPEALEPAIRRALNANRRSEELIAALLELARINTAARSTATAIATSASAAVARRSLPPIVERGLAERAGEIAEKRLVVTTELAEVAVPLTGAGEALLALAVDNLIENAIRHNAEAGTIRIATGPNKAVGETGGGTRLEIMNTGPLFTDEEAARLTEPFNRGPGTRTSTGERGLGLGLTLVENIVASLGAALTLEAAEEGGLRARIDFTDEEAVSEQGPPSEVGSGAGSEPTQRGTRPRAIMCLRGPASGSCPVVSPMR